MTKPEQVEIEVLEVLTGYHQKPDGLSDTAKEVWYRMRRMREAEAALRSISAMLGWGNVPPLKTLEMEISALKALAAGAKEK